MRDLKFNLISLMFRLKPSLKREVGKDSSRRVLSKMKNHYKEIDKREPQKKGIMTYHRQLWIIGLSLYRAMQEESYNIDFNDYFAYELESLKPLEEDGLIELSEQSIKVTPTGLLLLRAIAMKFDEYLIKDNAGKAYSKVI